MSALFGSGPFQALGLGTLAGAASSLADPLLTAVSRRVNSATLTAVPEPGQLFALANANLLSPNALREAMRWHGILVGEYGVLNTFQGGLWNAVLEGHRKVPGIDQIMSAGARGVIDPLAWRNGIMRGGGQPETWSRLFDAYVTLPSVGDLVVARNRQIITPADFDLLLRRHGVYYPAHRALIDSLRLQLPGPAELIQWVVREAFDLDVVRRWGYDAEVPDVARPFFEAAGLFGRFTRRSDTTGETQEVDHLAQTWAAHWLPLAPGQSYELLHRVREDNVEKYRRLGLNVQPWTTDDVRSWLKIADYPPNVRDYLIALAYRPTRLIDIRAALKLGLKDKAWAVGQFRDHGMHPDDAQLSADLAERQGAESRASAVRAQERTVWGQAIVAIRAAYEAGMVDRGAAVNQLVEAGVNPAAADTMANVADARAFTKLVQSAVRAVRRDYLGGALTAAEADAALQVAGMQPNPRQRMLTAWGVELGHARRVASTQQVRDWYLEGLMTLEEAQRRLRNLGWAEPDVQLHLVSYLQKAGQARAKAQAAAQKSQRAQAAELEKLQKQLQSEQEKVRSTLRRLSPIAKLQKWFVAGIITEAYFRRRSLAMGYDEDATSKWFAEAQQAKEKADAKAAESGAAAQAGPPGA